MRGLRFILQISMMILNLHFGVKKCENKKSKLIFILIQLSEMHRAGRIYPLVTRVPRIEPSQSTCSAYQLTGVYV